jgi:purine-binding chemotaxis protein CheW
MNDILENRADGVLECVAFTVSTQVYCLDIMVIREIRRSVAVTRLPHADQHVLGVINLRGNVIPVYDLAVHFGLERTAPGPRNVVIIADVDGQSFGLLVESVSEIITVEKSSVQDPPKLIRDRQTSLVDGLIPIDEGMAQLINIRHIARERADSAI